MPPPTVAVCTFKACANNVHLVGGGGERDSEREACGLVQTAKSDNGKWTELSSGRTWGMYRKGRLKASPEN